MENALPQPQEQVQPQVPHAADFVSKGDDITNQEDGAKLLKYFQTITTATPQPDDRGEEYIDLSDCGAIDDQNQIIDIESRRELWDNDGAPYPQLRGRQVIFDFARPLFEKAREALTKGTKVVLITGTPGIGKSALRNVHAHFLLSEARNRRARCCVIFAKGKTKMIRLHLEANGSYHVELVEPSSRWAALGYPGFKRGVDLFILADVSHGAIEDMSGPVLIIYSSPNQNLRDAQIMKASSLTLGCPLLTKTQLCRYTNKRMDLMFERYGGLARLVWGDTKDEDTHKSRLLDKLKDVDGFLSTLDQKDYLKGPHHYFYTQVQQDDDGNPLFNLDRHPPTVVPAPRFVVKMVAERIVANLLQPSLNADFGKLHKAVDGVLFEEVCLYLIEHHANKIEFQVRNISNKKRPLTGFLTGNRLQLKDFKTRKDVDSADLVEALNGDETPFLVVPKASNFAGLDAILALGVSKKRKRVQTPTVAVDLQMTRSLVHLVADEGVDILNKIDSRMSSAKHCLLFLVPEYNFSGFKKQTAKSDSTLR